MKLEKVEAKIGICFQDRSLLRLALTHRSYAQNTGDPKKHNERLEFLGDAILGVVVADYLYHHCFYLEVGKLTQLQNKLVSNSMLVKVASRVGLREFILLGQAEELNRVREKSKQLFADAFEALLGAIYLERGYQDAQQWLIKQFIYPVLQPHLKKLQTRKQPKEQLEFLGNAIIKAIAATYVYLYFPNVGESSLTHLRQQLVYPHNLIEFEGQINPGEFIFPADTLKALLGAIYLRQSFSDTYIWFVNRFLQYQTN